MPQPQWISKMVEHEGHPLALRVQPSAGEAAMAGTFPQLAIITHEFIEVRDDGMPMPDYNDALLGFDLALQAAIQDSGEGKVMIVETFGGRRNYYGCVRDRAAYDCWVSQVREENETALVFDYKADAARRFYVAYKSSYGW